MATTTPNSLLRRWPLLLMVFVAGCATTTPVTVPATPISTNAIVIVIDDPRGNLRRHGSGPGYQRPVAYTDDPILSRHADAIASDYGLTVIEQWPLRNLAVHCFVVERPADDVLTAVNADPRVRWSQPFNEMRVQTETSRRSGQAGDCLFCEFDAQFRGLGRDVTIAVIDTAVDTAHPDLRRSSVMTQNFAGARGNPDEEDHGTAVVGLIAAVAETETGLTGVAPEAKVHLLRGCWQSSAGDGRCNTLTLALALDAAIDLQPDVLNLSLTGRRDRVLDELLGVLLANGTLVVAAHDEQRTPEARFPSRQAGVVYAYGIDQTPSPDNAGVLFAPRHALSLTPMAGYDLVSGHSIATPQLAAMAARLMEHDEDASRNEIVTRLTAWLRRFYTGQTES